MQVRIQRLAFDVTIQIINRANKEDPVKRIFFGFVWFVVFSFGGLLAGGAIAGAIAGSQVKATDFSEAYAKGEQAGQAAGAAFGQEYGSAIFLAALVLSVAGTATGFLPGTKKKPSQ